METRVLIRSSPKLNAANPHHREASDYSILIDQLASEILMFDARSDAGSSPIL